VTFAALDALGPSLMPRTSRLQGIAMGLSVLGARATAGAAERLTRLAVPAEAPLARQLTARAVIGVGGTALAGGVLGWRARQLRTSQAVMQQWPLPQTTTLPATLATSYAVTAVGTGLTRGYVWSRGAMEAYFGPGPGKRLLARLGNAGVWTAGAIAAYNLGVAAVGRANEEVEPAYATPPDSPLVSGGPGSLLPFADLGQQGRRYVPDVLTPELIQEVMGEAALAQPIRVYVGFDSQPLYPTGRAELALAELDRTGPSTGRICCWCPPPAPAGSTTP
jgi:uncharacterized membrane protein